MKKGDYSKSNIPYCIYFSYLNPIKFIEAKGFL